jgi:hypothetical protein
MVLGMKTLGHLHDELGIGRHDVVPTASVVDDHGSWVFISDGNAPL